MGGSSSTQKEEAEFVDVGIVRFGRNESRARLERPAEGESSVKKKENASAWERFLDWVQTRLVGDVAMQLHRDTL
jgi:hypothetical protein